MKKYKVFHSGGTEVCLLNNTCITKVTKEFIKTLDKPSIYELDNESMSRIYYKDNNTISSDYLIIEIE